jgi:hypothetical protein
VLDVKIEYDLACFGLSTGLGTKMEDHGTVVERKVSMIVIDNLFVLTE